MYSPKQLRVLGSARQIFLRYGFKRVTMNDVAASAGISRPGLYLLFKSKEEIFIGVYRQWTAETLDAIRARLDLSKPPLENLKLAFEAWAIRPFELMQGSEEARELMDCEFDFAREIAAAAHLEFEQILASILKTDVQKGKRKLSPKVVAKLLRSAAVGLKREAVNAAEYRTLVDDLLALLIERT